QSRALSASRLRVLGQPRAARPHRTRACARGDGGAADQGPRHAVRLGLGGAEAMSPKRVSVVVPVRDRREMLEALLAGLAGQSYSDFEVVVVDDGSIDGSGDAAKSAGENGLEVLVLRTEGVGAVEARKRGVMASQVE